MAKEHNIDARQRTLPHKQRHDGVLRAQLTANPLYRTSQLYKYEFLITLLISNQDWTSLRQLQALQA